MDIKNVVIIGAGPAGIATAIQLKRYHIEPLLLEQEEIGGLLRNAHLVENYLGFPEGIGGLELVKLFRKQLKNIGVKVSFEKVLELEYKNKVFLTTTNRRIITSTIVVIATGTKPKKLSGLPITNEIKDRIFYEIYPILGINNKKIIIIGAGDVAFDYALHLSGENEVVILNRSKQAECLPVLRESCLKTDKISYLTQVSVSQINKEHSQLLLTGTYNNSQEKIHIKTDYLVVAIGREPCLSFLGNELRKSCQTLIKTKKLYLVGDVKNGVYRQTAIGIGDGLEAAMGIYRNFRRNNL